MRVSDHQRALDLFERVADLPAAERAAVLSEACGDAGAVRGLVEHMLAADRDAPALQTLELGCDASIAAEDEEYALPTQIGEYEVIELLGRGATGLVYRARQVNPPREVAIKVLAPHRSDRATRARLAREARILGRLQHPNIAQVYAAGDEVGPRQKQPYVVMEYVRGVRLHDYATAAGLSLRERLELLAEICDAVAYAHQRGVIHRDLKPANILVERLDDGKARPRILDFGVATLQSDDASEQTAATLPGALVGTLAYMSPEQYDADPQRRLDPRCDVYSLGVLGYELLTGALPIEIETLPIYAALSKLRETAVTPLAVRSRSFRGDLNRIFAVALARDPEQRYASAADLARDLRRYLRNEPIRAREPSLWYVGRKFAQRNRFAVAAGCLALLLAAGAGVALNVALVQTREALAEAREAHVEREAQFRELRDTTAFLAGEFARQLEQVLGTAPLRADLVQRLHEQVEDLRARYPDDVALLRTHANLYGHLAELAETDRAGAIAERREQIALLRRLVTLPGHEPDDWAQLSIALVRLGDYYNTDGVPAYIECFHEALEIDERLAREHPTERHFLDNLAHSYIRLNWQAKRQADYEGARALLDQALVVANRMRELDENHPLTLHLMRELHVELAAAAEDRNDIDGILEHRERAIHFAERALALIPDRPAFVLQAAASHRSLGFGLRSVGELDRAAEHAEIALRHAEKLYRIEPDVLEHVMLLAATRTDIARVRLVRGDLHGALEPTRAACELCLRYATHAECHPRFLLRLQDVVKLFVSISRRLGEGEQAIPFASAMLAAHEDCAGSLRSPRDALWLADQYNLHTVEAVRDSARAERILREVFTFDAHTPPAAWIVLARTLRLQGRFAEAAEALQRAGHDQPGDELAQQVAAERRRLARAQAPRSPDAVITPVSEAESSDGG